MDVPGRVVSRRRFLGWAVGGLGAAGTVGAAVSLGRGSPSLVSGFDADVGVIGAGTSGLAAADWLVARGRSVVVLEARDRLGGRCHSVRAPFVDGQVAEAGGEFLDRQHTVMRGYARRFGLHLETVGAQVVALDGLIYRSSRRAIDTTFLAEFRVGEAQAMLDREVVRLGRGVNLADPAATSTLESRNVQSLLDSLPIAPEARWLLASNIRDAYGIDVDAISLLFYVWAESIGPDQRPSDVEIWRVAGGNDQIIAGLAAQLRRAVHLDTAVTNVVQVNGGVMLATTNGNLRVKAVLVTAPLPALRTIDFTPALPKPVRDAIASAQYGTGGKTLAQYTHKPWREHGMSGDVTSDLATRTTWEATDAQAGRSGILIAFTAGHAGSQLAALDPRVRVATVRADIDTALPGTDIAFGRAQSFMWSNDPLAGGTYFCPQPGYFAASYRPLRSRHGRLRFAGEHTDTIYVGYLEGAARSGIRAAQALVTARLI